MILDIVYDISMNRTCPEKRVVAAHLGVDALDLGVPAPEFSTACDKACEGPVLEVRSGLPRRVLHAILLSVVPESVEVPVCPRADTLQTP